MYGVNGIVLLLRMGTYKSVKYIEKKIVMWDH